MHNLVLRHQSQGWQLRFGHTVGHGTMPSTCDTSWGRPYPYMCLDMCIDMCLHMCIDVCIDIGIDMCIDVCIDMCIGMCIDMSAMRIRADSIHHCVQK